MSPVMRGTVSIVVALLLFFGAVIGGTLYLKSVACHARWKHTERQTEWGLFSKCLVESNGKLVPENRVWYERNQ